MKMLLTLAILLKLSIVLAQKYISHTEFECEGKDAGNYTRVSRLISDRDCNVQSYQSTSNNIIQFSPNGEVHNNIYERLTISQISQGATKLVQQLGLLVSGPLQGKFLYLRDYQPITNNLKKCSSILGQSRIIALMSELMIADKLDLNVLLAPNGAYEVFKKGSTTICRGYHVLV